MLRELTSLTTEQETTTSFFLFIRPKILRDSRFRDLRYLSDIELQDAQIPGDFPVSRPIVIPCLKPPTQTVRHPNSAIAAARIARSVGLLLLLHPVAAPTHSPSDQLALLAAALECEIETDLSSLRPHPDFLKRFGIAYARSHSVIGFQRDDAIVGRGL